MTDSATNNYEVYEDDYVKRHTLSTEAINDLQSIALRMYSSNFLDDGLKVYVSERKSAMDVRLRHLDIEKLSITTCRRLEWAVLKMKIKMWIKAAIICFRYYFVIEKQLCEQIFRNLGDESNYLWFMDIVKDHMIQLFDAADTLSCIRPASERLFMILDLHDTLSDLLPSIDNLSNSQLLTFRAINLIIPRLADKAKEILQKFESSLLNEASPVVHAEPIHRLSSYLMKYVYKLCDHKHTLMRLSLPNLPSMDAAGIESTSFSLHVDWIIMRLVSNIEVKSKLCKDPPATQFFAMNNFHYIIRVIHAHEELQRCVVDDNLMKLTKNFIQARSEFLNLTVNVVLRSLKDERLNKVKFCFFKVSILTARLRRFNNGFEKLKKNVGYLGVPDHELMSKLRDLIVEMVVTEYTSFLLHTEKVPHLKTYVKYSAEEIESAIKSFFYWNPDRR